MREPPADFPDATLCGFMHLGYDASAWVYRPRTADGGITQVVAPLPTAHGALWHETRFIQGYCDLAVDPLALAYYRHAWAVGDIAAFGAEVCFRPDLGPATRRAATTSLMGLFQPARSSRWPPPPERRPTAAVPRRHRPARSRGDRCRR